MVIGYIISLCVLSITCRLQTGYIYTFNMQQINFVDNVIIC